MAFAQMLQGLNISIDQRLFLFMAPALELPLARNGRRFGVENLGIHEIGWTVLECVCRTEREAFLYFLSCDSSSEARTLVVRHHELHF